MNRRTGRQNGPALSSRRADSDGLENLEQTLGIPPGQAAWLEQALTHRSQTRDRGEEERESNERLEFLGDAVVQLVVSEMLYERFPRWSEGQLTRARAAVVSRDPLTRAAQRLDLGRYLRLGRSEDELGGRERPSILSSAFEAVAAAVYLTSGLDAAEIFLRAALSEELEAVESSPHHSDPKTRLQELCQSRGRGAPIYRVLDVSGPAHNRTFTAGAVLGDEVLGTGSGRSKKEAEQSAASRALESLSGTPSLA